MVLLSLALLSEGSASPLLAVALAMLTRVSPVWAPSSRRVRVSVRLAPASSSKAGQVMVPGGDSMPSSEAVKKVEKLFAVKLEFF